MYHHSSYGRLVAPGNQHSFKEMERTGWLALDICIWRHWATTSKACIALGRTLSSVVVIMRKNALTTGGCSYPSPFLEARLCMCSVARAKRRSPPPTTHLNEYRPRTDLTNSLSYRCLLPQLSSITSLQPHRIRPPPLPLPLGSSSLSQTAPSLASASISFALHSPTPLRRSCCRQQPTHSIVDHFVLSWDP
jgi:hypothetical protein